MDTNEINNKRNGTVKFAILSIVLIVMISFIGYAFARYVTSLNGNTEAPITQWNFKVTAGSCQSLNIDLAQTRYANDTTEVDRTKVAPGTKGALVLNIDATGSQVSLKYDIELSLTQIPENLIFYYDEDMTNAMLKENGKIHIDGYFGANDNNKTATKNLYWQWKLETGSTQTEIDANDLLDSEWMGDSISLGIEATGRQVMEDPSTQYNVTLDLNGGTLANHGDSTQITKQVNYGETYGNLPIPKREGYTFEGWSGKNLINLEVSESIPSDTDARNTSKRTFIPYTYVKGLAYNNYYRPSSVNFVEIKKNLISFRGAADYGIGFPILAVPNKNYTLQYKLLTEQHRAVASILFYKVDGTLINYISFQEQSGEKEHKFTTPEDTYYLTICFGSTSNEKIEVSDIQLEEGTLATEYEEFNIINNETEVLNNQYLTAVWIKK